MLRTYHRIGRPAGSVDKKLRTRHRIGRPAGSEVKMLRTRHRIGRPAGSVDKMLRTRHRIGRPAGSEVKMLRLHLCELVNFIGVCHVSRCPNELPGQAGRQSVAGGHAPCFAQELGKLRLAYARGLAVGRGQSCRAGKWAGWRARSCFAG